MALSLFKECGLKLIEELQGNEEEVNDLDTDNRAIVKRANELIEKHPDKREMFEGYVQSQLNECADIESNLTEATWLLQKM